MGITSNFDERKLKDFLLGRTLQQFEAAVVNQLQYLGEMCVNEARERGSYKDRTGNLRGSIGYGVFKDGEPVTSGGFEPVNGSPDGPDTGRTLLAKIGGENPQGFSLVVVAGMNYAVYVEARGYNVLTSSELLAERELPGLLNDLFEA